MWGLTGPLSSAVSRAVWMTIGGELLLTCWSTLLVVFVVWLMTQGKQLFTCWTSPVVWAWWITALLSYKISGELHVTQNGVRWHWMSRPQCTYFSGMVSLIEEPFFGDCWATCSFRGTSLSSEHVLPLPPRFDVIIMQWYMWYMCWKKMYFYCCKYLRGNCDYFGTSSGTW